MARYHDYLIVIPIDQLCRYTGEDTVMQRECLLLPDHAGKHSGSRSLNDLAPIVLCTCGRQFLNYNSHLSGVCVQLYNRFEEEGRPYAWEQVNEIAREHQIVGILGYRVYCRG